MMRGVIQTPLTQPPSYPTSLAGDTSMSDIEQEVVSIVARIAKVPPARLTRDTDLKSELNIDSLQGLQIIAALEQRFDVVLRDEDLDNYTSVGAIVETLTRHVPPPE